MPQPRKYATNAARQRAYRERRAQDHTLFLPDAALSSRVAVALDATPKDAKPALINAALAHYLACPHRAKVGPFPLSGAELRAARDPYQALRTECQRLYQGELQETLDTLVKMLGADRSTFAPTSLAAYARKLDRALKAILKLLAPGTRHETGLERWQDPDAYPPTGARRSP